MRRQLVAIAGALVLAGCADRLAVTPIDIQDKERYLAHIAECSAPALSYRPRVSIAQILFGAISGALNVASYAVLYPTMPIAGAGSGAAKAALSPWDPSGHARQNIFRHCVTDKVNRDRSATIANPDD